MVSVLSKTDIPRDRVDVLHILVLNGDDLTRLSPGQIAATRRIYALDDPRSVAERMKAGDLE